MALSLKFPKIILKLVIALTALACTSEVAWATSKSEALDISAESIAKLIEDKALVEKNFDNDLITPTSIPEALGQIIETISQGDKDRYLEALALFETLVNETKNKDAFRILEIYKDFSELNDFSKTISNYETKRDYFNTLETHNNWFVNFHIKQLLSLTHSNSRHDDLALQVVQEALNLIPENITEEAVSARIIATELIAYLQNLKLNKDLAIINTQRLIDLKLAAGQSIDGVELINNLMYSHTVWRDDEVRLVLAQTLKRLEQKHGSTTPGLSSIHISRVYNDIADYEKAKISANEALKEANLDSLQQIAYINLATAYAGLGETKKAKETLDLIPDDVHGKYTIPYAKTLIALNEGRTDDALKLMNERYNMRVRSLLEEKTKDTAEVLASLSNSSERQAEREEALQREAFLVKSQLEQQQKINTLLIGLLSLLFIAGITGSLFTRHRHKLAQELVVKTKEAASADKMKTEFLGMMSHELRTPLNGIIGLADVMVQTGPTDQVKERAEIILSSGNELFNVIEGIIDMSRIEGNKLEITPEPGSVQDVARGLCEKWEEKAAEKPISFTYYITNKNTALFDIDSLRVEQCINTLLSNAIKFTDRGQVHLHLTCDEDSEADSQTFTVIVADTGQGMSETVQSKLFTPFLQADISMTRKHGGSGLRLAIARATARLMGGDITVNSRDGAGSEFIFTFEAKPSTVELENTQPQPLIGEKAGDLLTADQASPREAETISVSPQDDDLASVIETTLSALIPAEKVPPATDLLAQYSVLIINDETTREGILRSLLQPFGANCVIAENGASGCAHLKVQTFDCLILDIHGPNQDTLNLLKTIRQSHEIWSGIPILILSQDTSAEQNAICMAAGADIFLTKPVPPSDLTDAIKFLREQYEMTQAENKNFLQKRRA